MTTDIINRIDSLLDERKQHADALHAIDGSLTQIQQLLSGTREVAAPRKRGRPPKSATSNVVAVGNSSIAGNEPVTLADHLEAVIKNAAQPQTIADLLAGVARSSYKSKAKDLRPVISLSLIKDKRFKRVERGVYGLK